MADNNDKNKNNKMEEKKQVEHKHENHEHAHDHNHDHSHDHAHEHSHAPAAPTVDAKAKKAEIKKPAKVERPKKSEAIAKAVNIHASKKHCMYLCSFIKNKSIDQALKEVAEVTEMKRVIPFKGEIPHRHELGGKPGRTPVNASKEFIYLLKALKGNSIENGLDLSKTRISFASATWSSRQAKRGGARFKRAFVLLKAKEFNNMKSNENSKAVEAKK